MKHTLQILAILIAVQLSLDAVAQEYKYKVTEKKISKEEFVEAYRHLEEHNLIKDTTLSWHKKKSIEVAVFNTLTDELKSDYVWGDFSILNIGCYPTGEYIADLWAANWCGAVFLNSQLEVDTMRIDASIDAAYSKDGIYVGYESFYGGGGVALHFYACKDNIPAKMEEIAFYRKTGWAPVWWITPEWRTDDRFKELQELGINTPMVWYKGALYCAGVNYSSDTMPYYLPEYLKLELKKPDVNFTK